MSENLKKPINLWLRNFQDDAFVKVFLGSIDSETDLERFFFEILMCSEKNDEIIVNFLIN